MSSTIFRKVHFRVHLGVYECPVQEGSLVPIIVVPGCGILLSVPLLVVDTTLMRVLDVTLMRVIDFTLMMVLDFSLIIVPDVSFKKKSPFILLN